MATTYEEITFRRISRNRFRCNQTLEIVPASKIKGYKSKMLSVGKVSSGPKIYDYHREVSRYSYIYCPVPTCTDRFNVGHGSDIYTCDNGHKVRVNVV